MAELTPQRHSEKVAMRTGTQVPDMSFPLPIVRVSLLLYVLACALPTYNNREPGVELLVLGWSGLLFGGQLGWLANPFLWGSWYFVQRQRFGTAAVLSAIGFILGLDSFTLEFLPTFQMPYPVTSFGIGMYVWLGSIAIVVLGALVAGYGKRLLSRFR